MEQSDELIRIFREEATEFIETLLDDVTQLAMTKGDSFKETLEKVLRTTHNLKGAATSTGSGTVEILIHALEGILGRKKRSEGPLSQSISECAIDALGIMQAAVDGVVSDTQVQEMIDRLASLGGEVIKPAQTKSDVVDSMTGDNTDNKYVSDSRSAGTKSAIRVDTRRLDHLMGFIGEFLTFHARLADRYNHQAEIYLNRAVAFVKTGFRAEARKDLGEAIHLNRSLPQAYESRGLLALRDGDTQLAIQDFTKAIQLGSDGGVVQYNL